MPMNISALEKARRARFARTQLLPRAIAGAGKKGFTATRAGLARHKDKVKSPSKLAGWLKARAKERK